MNLKVLKIFQILKCMKEVEPFSKEMAIMTSTCNNKSNKLLYKNKINKFINRKLL